MERLHLTCIQLEGGGLDSNLHRSTSHPLPRNHIIQSTILITLQYPYWSIPIQNFNYTFPRVLLDYHLYYLSFFIPSFTIASQSIKLISIHVTFPRYIDKKKSLNSLHPLNKGTINVFQNFDSSFYNTDYSRREWTNYLEQLKIKILKFMMWNDIFMQTGAKMVTVEKSPISGWSN